MGLLGLGLRAGHLVIGVDGVRRALQQGSVHCLVVAEDASRRAAEKVVALAEARNVARITGPPAGPLGERLGRPPVMVVGVTDRALARGIESVARS